ncbi:hypothetical protein F5B22DRAFT_621407 [Xylaria bambusicola]|uniref:uncharacterized protein n=1 Tax=Xylaria bambusicola TaxID=326684 RepID=UPI002007FBD7|nr:uncharacterized protein F5B22DRAFT_621407 [Xylaria bambusicola]KAI0508261.1 hypothetical protein F5B22DRAFT_621407 [Xylaria bambusicola]
MNISRIDRSRYGAVFFSQPLPTARSKTRYRAVCTYNGHARSVANDFHITLRRNRLVQPQWPHTPLRNIFPHRTFCAAVAPAGARSPLSSNFFTPCSASVRNWKRTTVSSAEPAEKSHNAHRSTSFDRRTLKQSKDEVLGIVDYYDNTSVEETFQFYRDPYFRKYANPNGPDVVVSDKPEDLELQTISGERRFVEDEFVPAQELRKAIALRRQYPSRVSLDTIWELYHALPEPRPVHISGYTRHALTAALGSVERKDQKSMLRYFAVIDDIKNSGFSLTSIQWNTAMSFATSYVARTTVVEVEAALKLWHQMEKDAGLKATEVTFNILFDSASKAGNFTLAEMVYEEMNHRGYAFNRYHYTSLIHLFGLKQDSSGIRAGYREMVEAGEIVDTVVVNCLIASFLRCGEEPSAEHVYEKMKAYNKELPTLPHRDYTMAKAINKVLAMFTRVSKKHPSMHPTFQKSALLSPDLQTYRILINHYGLRLGNLSKVAQFLDEMKAFMVPLNGVVFLALFQSFSVHGGPGSDWSAQRLTSVWNAFLDALDSGADGVYISTWLAMAALDAHARYSNHDELLGVYDCLKSRWELDEKNTQYMLHYLHLLLTTGRTRANKSRWTSRFG